eukprot:753947-Hanusia_phi.AAC.3
MDSTESSWGYEGIHQIITFSMQADGFLYKMCRILVSNVTGLALIGNLKPDEVSKILQAKNRSLAGQMAPANALFFDRVDYDTAASAP